MIYQILFIVVLIGIGFLGWREARKLDYFMNEMNIENIETGKLLDNLKDSLNEIQKLEGVK